ncbi:protein SPIRRIG-like [Impatiens glandulifera]|uniref:protein SPIRRIG-like n=1 Tax=Impatiens glandulifera TaxID=253017 RepID=UPI001FB16028|nr:protein SPIRRIG-like [Impatiens glandulifera]
MKWVSLLKDFREKVGLSQSASTSSLSSPSTPPSALSSSLNQESNVSINQEFVSSFNSRDSNVLELEFKRYWEDFRSSSSEKEKENALNMTVDRFCRLIKQHTNVAQVITMLVETHIFSFVLGRALVTDIDKLRISSKSRSLEARKVLLFFSEASEDGLKPGTNLLFAVEMLVYGPVDKQSLLDSGILCCLIHILNALLGPDGGIQKMDGKPESLPVSGTEDDLDTSHVRRLEIEGSVVHIMKALASHPSAAQSLIEDDSMQLLFQMVANGSLYVFSLYKEGLGSLHTIQLHRHAMQILGLLLVNDNGTTAKYIRKFHLIKVLLLAIKDFNPDSGDPAYTMGIVDLLLECVELSCRPEAGGVRLREDIHNAHGYHFLVQFALTLSKQSMSAIHCKPYSESNSTSDGLDLSADVNGMVLNENGEDIAAEGLSPVLSRLLDVLVNLAQTGPADTTASVGNKGSKGSHGKSAGHSRRHTSSFERIVDTVWEKENNKVKDLEAVQMLQDIFLKADSRELQAEVLNRIFKIFSSNLENYKLCQELRTVPLLILNMGGFPWSLQEIILKILEYAVTVVNCIPDQELLSLCCLLQQQIMPELKHTILAFFVKLLSFDQQYKKVLREVGVLEVLLDDLKQHKFLLGTDQFGSDPFEWNSSSSSFKKHLDSKDTILSSPKLLEYGSAKFPIFEVEATISVAWDCMVSLIKKADANQSAFRLANGPTILLPFLASDVHRQGALRVFSCLIIEDVAQAHPEELGALVEVLKSGIVTNATGSQYRLLSHAICDTFGALWRILGVNNSAQMVFGEATGFSLLLTTLHHFHNDGEQLDLSSLVSRIKVFTYLLRMVTAAVCNHSVNRMKLHTIISSQTFYDLLFDSGLICTEYERQVIQLLVELALELVLPPSFTSELASDVTEIGSNGFLLQAPAGVFTPHNERVCNAGAIRVLIHSLLLFSPSVQLQVLNLIEKLAHVGSFNLENLTSVGCVELLLEKIHPFLSSSSPLVSHALKIVEVLGAYRLSASELRVLIRYVLQMRLTNSGHVLVDMMEKLIVREDMASENVSLAPFLEMDMTKLGYAGIQLSLGERSWPPVAGYSFVCWFQFRNLLKSQIKETETKKGSGKTQVRGGQYLRIFSVGAIDNASTFYAELYLQEDGSLTLATSNSSSLSFSGLELEEGRWHHLAVVHSKPNALAGLFQSSVAYVYLNGKLKHTGKLGYSPSPVGKLLQVNIGTPVTCARISNLSWRLRSCYLFEEVLTPGAICFMYILGRGYRGLFQDTDLLQFVPIQACSGGSMAIIDSLETDWALVSNSQRPESASKQASPMADRSGIVWDWERLGNLSLQLSGKNLIFAFDGTSTESLQASGTFSLLNLVDPMSAAASPIGGIPRFGRLHGDIYICRQCVIGDSIRPVGGMAVILALVEAAETRDMLHMALKLLACALHQNPQNVKDMQMFRGYHLLALFLHRKMSLFDMQSLEIFFGVAACEASFPESKKFESTQRIVSSAAPVIGTSFEDLSLSKVEEEFSSVGSQGDTDDFFNAKDSYNHITELENADIHAETPRCLVLSNADMVEHVLLDWTLWVTASVSVQIALLGFLEHLVSMHWYRNHNLTILRRMNLVQHLLVTLQRGDVEVIVLEKLVVLLGVILEDGFLDFELEHVVRFLIMTFDPPEPKSHSPILRESMGKHVIVRNMLLEMLIDLQVTIDSDEMLEQWHKIVSSKLITYFLDEAVHPTSMRWIMTLLGVSLVSSPTFALKFRTSGGYQGLARVLPSFYDSPDIYYILFCLIFGKPVYPRLPEVRMLDFHALMPSDGNYEELRFVELLDSVIAMAKSTFERLYSQSILAHQSGSLSQVATGLVAELADGNIDMAGELQGEALMHKTYAARLMGGEASAPSAATSVLRFMVDMAKMCPPFSAVCRRADFLENCIDLYFSCVRSAHALKLAKQLSVKTENKSLNVHDDDRDTNSSQNSFSSFPHEQEQSVKTSISLGSFPKAQISTSSEDLSIAPNTAAVDKIKTGAATSKWESNTQKEEDSNAHIVDQQSSAASSIGDLSFYDIKDGENLVYQADSQRSESLVASDSTITREKTPSRLPPMPASSPVVALKSVGSPVQGELKYTPAPSTSNESFTYMSEFDSEMKSSSHGPSDANTNSIVNPKLLLEVDDVGYGGGPCSAGATAVLDFVAEVLSDFMTEQLKSVSMIESILESAPLYVDAESLLVFQGLCLIRLMNFLERRLLRDDEEDETKLDKGRWTSNLDALCWIIVDRVYMGAFPNPGSVLRTLEFLLSMLQLANKDGRIEGATPTGKGLLSITRGTKQLEAYVHAVLKNVNRMISYCFLPSFLTSIGEDNLLSLIGLPIDHMRSSLNISQEECGIDICTVLQLLDAHRQVIFCPSNQDTDLNCCLCVNLISLLRDQRQNVQNITIDILRYLLVHRKVALEDLLVSKLNQGPQLDLLHGGFDKLLAGRLSDFYIWFHSAEPIVNKVLEQCAAIMWAQYIAGSVKFPGVRIKGMDSRRKREVGRRSRDIAKLDQKHWEQVSERRYALEVVRELMSAELRVVRQDKYGWVLQCESKWKTRIQQLVHERGIFPMHRSSLSEGPEWQLCLIEGPYRMRKKLERPKLKIGMTHKVLNGQFEWDSMELSREKNENSNDALAGSHNFSDLLTDGVKYDSFDGEPYEEPMFRELENVRDVASSRVEWNDDPTSSLNDMSLHSATDYGMKSSTVSLSKDESLHGRSALGSPRNHSSLKSEEVKMEDQSDKMLNDNGEYLIRPYLEPFEKIKHRYNCERVVGLDKHDGIFLIGELALYVIENFYINNSGCICEKESEDDLSMIDQALGVNKDFSFSSESHPKSISSGGAATKTYIGGRAWAYNGGAWGKEKACNSSNMPHLWHMWNLDSVHEILRRDYQLRPVAIELFSMDGYNDLLVFHKKEREEVFKNLVAMNLPRNSMLDSTISGLSKQDGNEGGRLFKITARSFSKRWQNGEISNFQYLMHLNTLAGRGYSDLTQYPVFPWILADYESEILDLSNPTTFRRLDKPMGCQSLEGAEEFRKRYESWDDPDVPKFHYGSHYSSAGIVLFYLIRLPPFSTENQKLQGGQFDHADRLFNSIKDTWSSAAGRSNTSDVKELIPEFFYAPEFLENRFSLDLGEKQSGEKVGDVFLPPWAKGSAREFIRKHREALESDYVSENLHHWIDLIFGYKQRGKAAEEAINVFYHYTYEGSVDIDSITEPAMKASILAQINNFGQTPKQLFQKAHVKRRSDRKPPHPLKHSSDLIPHELRKTSSSIAQIVTFNDKVLLAGANSLLKPQTYTKCVSWGFPDRSLRFVSYDQDKLLSTHENLHGGNQIQCAGVTHDGQVLVTGADDGLVCAWKIVNDSFNTQRRLVLAKALCGHTGKVTSIRVSQPYMMIVSGSDDRTVIIWDLSSLVFIRQLPEFPSPVSAIYVNDLTGEIVTAAGVMLAVWSINGDCLAVINTSQLPSDFIISLTSCTFSDWLDTNWYVTGHQSGAMKVWQMVHCSEEVSTPVKAMGSLSVVGLDLGEKSPEYRLILRKVLKFHKHAVTALHLTSDLKQLLSGDSDGHLLSWTLPDESLRGSLKLG